MATLRKLRRRGMVLVWAAIVMLGLILVVALAGDTAHVYLAGHQLQNAADAAALAGVWEVREEPPLAHNRAIAVAAENRAGQMSVQLAPNHPGNAGSGDVVIGFYDSSSDTFTPTFTQPNAVKVVARREAGSPAGPLPLIFGPMAGIGTSNVSRTAIAVIGGPLVDAGLILLNRQDPDTAVLTGTGAVTKIVIPDGAVQINSNHSGAVDWTGKPTIEAEALYIGSNQPEAGDLLVGGTLGVNSPPVEDPLAWLPIPPKGEPQNPGNQTNLNPGYYNGTFPQSGHLVLAPGIYFIDGGIRLRGNSSIVARDVMIFLNTGGIDMAGTTTISITPTTISPWTGVSIYQRRGNTSETTLRGTPDEPIEGTLYCPSAHLNIGGTPRTFGNQIIADTMHLLGNAQVTVDYDGRNPIQGHRVWLAR